VLPLERSYWLVLTVGVILKPHYGSVFARAVQRGVGTVVGAVLGAAILAVVPYGPWLLVPYGVLAALLPYGKARNFGLQTTFLTPLVVLLVDLLAAGGWHLAEARLIDTALASAVVLLIGYAPWPSAWQAHLPGQFAEALRAVSAYADEALVATPAARIAATGTARAGGQSPGAAPAEGSQLRRRTFRGAAVPEAASVHTLTATLRAVADAVETDVPPRPGEPLPADAELESVTGAVRRVLSVLAGRWTPIASKHAWWSATATPPSRTGRKPLTGTRRPANSAPGPVPSAGSAPPNVTTSPATPQPHSTPWATASNSTPPPSNRVPACPLQQVTPPNRMTSKQAGRLRRSWASKTGAWAASTSRPSRECHELGSVP
jgi:hypothetical protein